MLAHFADGAHRFIASPGQPFCSGIVADAGYDLVHAVFARPVPLAQGLEAARRHVEASGRPATAIAGLELRIPQTLGREGFDPFNAPYVERLAAMGLTGEAGPVTTRTNVAPTVAGVAEPSVHAVTYTVPGRGRPGPAFRLSGAAETLAEGTVAERLTSIVDVLDARMAELGVGWEHATAVQGYGPEGTVAGRDPGLLVPLAAAAPPGGPLVPVPPPVPALVFRVRPAGV